MDTRSETPKSKVDFSLLSVASTYAASRNVTTMIDRYTNDMLDKGHVIVEVSIFVSVITQIPLT